MDRRHLKADLKVVNDAYSVHIDAPETDTEIDEGEDLDLAATVTPYPYSSTMNYTDRRITFEDYEDGILEVIEEDDTSDPWTITPGKGNAKLEKTVEVPPYPDGKDEMLVCITVALPNPGFTEPPQVRKHCVRIFRDGNRVEPVASATPEITSLEPGSVDRGWEGTLRISGNHFESSCFVLVDGHGPITKFHNSGLVTAEIRKNITGSIGPKEVKVHNSDGGLSNGAQFHVN